MFFGRLNSLWKSAAPELIAVESLPSVQQCQRLLRVLFILWKNRAQGLGSHCRHCQMPVLPNIPDQVGFPIWHSQVPCRTQLLNPPSALWRTWGSARGTRSCPVELLGRTAVVCPSALHRPSASIVPKSSAMALPRTTQGCFWWEFGCLCRSIFSSKLSHAIATDPRALLRWWGFFLHRRSKMAGAGTSVRGSNSSAAPTDAAALMVVVWDLQVENSREKKREYWHI